MALSDVTVFGDYANDIPVFQAAGWAVAVANAQEAVKRHADEVIGHHEEDSVVRYLRNHWTGPGDSQGTRPPRVSTT